MTSEELTNTGLFNTTFSFTQRFRYNFPSKALPAKGLGGGEWGWGMSFIGGQICMCAFIGVYADGTKSGIAQTSGKKVFPQISASVTKC